MDAGALTAAEERVVQLIREAREELVTTVDQLVSCVTTARRPLPGDLAHDEAKLQSILGKRLRAIGAEVDVWEPEAIPAAHPLYPGGLDFAGRPQLAALIRGSGHGPSILTSGHIDAVTANPSEWRSDPFRATERDGRLYGRGVVDMKGGIASVLCAVEALQRAGVRLRGDIVFTTNTDEESSGAGSWAITQRGCRADGGICAEPTSFKTLIVCRGMVKPRITVRGRAGHTQFVHPHWSEGGPVNAIEKAYLVIGAIKELREEWRTRSDHQHPLLPPGDIIPTIISGGEWEVTYPPSCTISCDVQYVPAQADADGSGSTIKGEIMQRLNTAALADPWFVEHPLGWEWAWGVAPAEMAADHPLVAVLLDAGADLGRPGEIGGTGTWHDGANFALYGDTPCLSYGPGDVRRAHTVDEFIPVDEMVDYAAIIAVAVMRYCGT